MRAEERFNAAAKLRIAAACFIEKGAAFGSGPFEGEMKQTFFVHQAFLNSVQQLHYTIGVKRGREAPLNQKSRSFLSAAANLSLQPGARIRPISICGRRRNVEDS